MNDLWSEWQARIEAGPEAALCALPASLPDAASIPPREWLYGTRLIRRFVSVLAAPGGVGKSALALAQAVALATGRGFLGERVHHSVPVWVLNLEDPLDELHRRVAALMRLHRVPREALAGRLFLHSGRSRRVTMGTLDDSGIAHPDKQALIAACRQHGIGLLVVDPFVKSHRLDENSNDQMDEAATAWAEVAEATGAAVLLVHHVRKGANTGEIEGARGAKSLIDAARSAFLLAPMSPEDAQALSVPEPERWRYVRLDDGKANLAPPAEAAHWYRMESVGLGNGTAAYPAGDHVAAIALWKPPSAFSDMTVADCNDALDLIAAGPAQGSAFTAQRTGRASERWAGRILIERFGLAEAAAMRVIAAWLKSGLLREEQYYDVPQRKTRMGVAVTDALRPTAAYPRKGSQE